MRRIEITSESNKVGVKGKRMEAGSGFDEKLGDDGKRLYYCGDVLRHRANIHDIDVPCYLCGEDGCDFKTKTPSEVKGHKANIHDIDVTYYLCGEDVILRRRL